MGISWCCWIKLPVGWEPVIETVFMNWSIYIMRPPVISKTLSKSASLGNSSRWAAGYFDERAYSKYLYASAFGKSPNVIVLIFSCFMPALECKHPAEHNNKINQLATHRSSILAIEQERNLRMQTTHAFCDLVCLSEVWNQGTFWMSEN